MHQKFGVPPFSLRSEEVAFWTRRPLLKMQMTIQNPSNIEITDIKGIKLWPSILPFNTATKTATVAVTRNIWDCELPENKHNFIIWGQQMQQNLDRAKNEYLFSYSKYLLKFCWQYFFSICNYYPLCFFFLSKYYSLGHTLGKDHAAIILSSRFSCNGIS